MITRNDVVRLLALAAAYDQRTVGQEDVQAWLFVAQRERWTYLAAQAVIVEHYSRSTDRPRLTPAAVSDRLRVMRGRAAESFEAPRIPDGLANRDYPAWLRGQLAAHCDAILERWATTGEEPPRGIQPAHERITTTGELSASAPAEHRKAIAAGTRAMQRRRVPGQEAS